MIKNKKLRTPYENALMRLRLLDLYGEFFRFNQDTSPIQLLHQSVLHYLFKDNYYFISHIKPLLERQDFASRNIQGPWILLAQDTQGKVFSLVGDLEEQLISYLLASDFLNQYQLYIESATAMSVGWGAVVEKQSALSQNICEKTKLAVALNNEIVAFDKQFIQHSARIKEEKLKSLLHYKKTLEQQWQHSPRKIKKRLIQEIKEINKKSAMLSRQINNVAQANDEITAWANNKIRSYIELYPQYQQTLPENLFIHYFYDYRLQMQNTGTLTVTQKENIRYWLSLSPGMYDLLPQDIVHAYADKTLTKSELQLMSHSVHPLSAKGNEQGTTDALWQVGMLWLARAKSQYWGACYEINKKTEDFYVFLRKTAQEIGKITQKIRDYQQWR